MTSQYKIYLKYKDLEIKWIGEIPEGWEVHKLKYLLSTLESGSRETGGGNQLDEGIFSLGGEHINWDGTLNLENPKLISEEYYNLMNQGKLKINDVLLVKDGATIGKTAFFRKKEFEKMAVNEHVFLMRSNKRIDPKLLYYLICSDSGFKQIKLTEVGSAQGGINQDFIAKVYFSIPEDKQDQTAIANFLDKKTAEIDKFIEKDKKLIELLKEKRAALINYTVTKGLPVRRTQTGLDPKAKMKDSGIQLIEKIPENWNAMKLKHIVSRKITDGPHETPEFINEGIMFISAEAIKKDKIDFSKMRGYITKQVHKIYCAKCKPRKDDIFLVKSGATTGNVAIVETNDEFSIWSPLALIRSNKEKILPKLLYYILLTDYFKKTIELSWSFGTQQNIGMSVIENINIIIPGIGQQIYLLNYLNKATAKIDKTIQKIEQKIKLLEEYKKSLIHHTVTGKIDVRGSEI